MSEAPHLLHVFSTFVAGGPQVRTTRLANALGSRFRHTFLPMDGRDEARELLAPDVRARVLPGPPGRGALASVRGLRALLRAERPDLVLTYNWGAIEAVLAARLTRGLGRARVLHHEDGFLPDEVARFKRRRVWARRALLGGVDVVVPSANLERIACEVWRLPAARVHLIPNGVRPADFTRPPGPASVRRELGLAPDALVVGSVGHLRGEKSFPRLVEACALAGADVHLVLAGEGPERAAILAAAEAHGLEARVHLLGHREDPRAAFFAMDVFALSSDTEQMPVALLEAMACGLPVVGTDVGDVARMLPEAQQPFVVPRSAAALGAALRRLASEPELRDALGSANREHVAEHYDEAAMVRAYAARYTSATTDE